MDVLRERAATLADCFKLATQQNRLQRSFAIIKKVDYLKHVFSVRFKCSGAIIIPQPYAVINTNVYADLNVFLNRL